MFNPNRDSHRVKEIQEKTESSVKEPTIEMNEEISDPKMDIDIRISSHDAAVQILARLDDQSYQKAIHQDGISINENYLFSFSFPWRKGTRLPKKALKAMPHDIDELHAVTCCDGNLHAPFGDFNGPLGYGRFESGQSRGNYGVRLPASSIAGPVSVSIHSTLAARRSADQGVVQLAAQIPLPSSINSLTPDIWRERLVQESAANAEALSYLPHSWRKPSYSTKYPVKSTISSSSTVSQDTSTSTIQTTKAIDERDFSMKCLRRWNVSAKAEGVSTRSSLFPSPTVVEDDATDKSKQKVARPMLCFATLPEEVQTGRTVSTEQASKLDEAGLSHKLGSYDCRFTDKLLTQKKDSLGKTKKVAVGRTRLVWSNLIQDDESFASSKTNRVVYSSLISGRRLDQSRILRPREIKVGVRLRGKLVMEKAIENVVIEPTGNSKKRKHSTRHTAESEDFVKRQSIQVSETRTHEEIDDAIAFSLDGGAEIIQYKSLLAKSIENGARVYLEVESMNHVDIIASLLRFNKYKRAKDRSVEALSRFLKSYAPPRFAILSHLDDIPRSVCISSGKMPSTSVHELLRDASQADLTVRCSVCWSDKDVDQDRVQKCVSCGLLAHRSCCFDKGQITSILTDPNLNHCIGMVSSSNGHVDVNGISDVAMSQLDLSSHDRWQCAVCSRYEEKSRRHARLPSRFTVDMIQDESRQPVEDFSNGDNKNVPGPRCMYCHHKGGAMSLLEPSKSQQWVHEVCRIWSNADTPENKELETRPSHRNPKVSSTTCALCGGSGIKKAKSNCMGLTKCAAQGCYVAFHPMCALIASKITTSERESSVTPSGKHQLSLEQDEKKSEEECGVNADVVADNRLCNQYTLQLVQLPQTKEVIPVAFCGLHNGKRSSSFFGYLPGRDAIEG